jgi:hypothetical protein
VTAPAEGRPEIRVAGPDDAAALLQLKQCLDLQTSFMLLEPDERETSVQALVDELGAVVRSGNSVVIVAESADELVGYVELAGGAFRRNRTTAHLVIGVLAEAGGQGLARADNETDQPLSGPRSRSRGARIRQASVTSSVRRSRLTCASRSMTSGQPS